MLARADGKDGAHCVSGADNHVPCLGGAVHEVPLPQWPLLALDDEQGLAGEHEKILLIGFPVVQRSDTISVASQRVWSGEPTRNRFPLLSTSANSRIP